MPLQPVLQIGFSRRRARRGSALLRVFWSDPRNTFLAAGKNFQVKSEGERKRDLPINPNPIERNSSYSSPERFLPIQIRSILCVFSTGEPCKDRLILTANPAEKYTLKKSHTKPGKVFVRLDLQLPKAAANLT